MEGYLRKRGVRLALLFTIVLAAFGFVYVLQDIFAPLILGFLIAYILDPFADRLEDWRFSRLWAVITIFALATLVAAVIILTASFYATKGAKAAFQRAVGESKVSAQDPDAVQAPNPKWDPESPGAAPEFIYYRDVNGNGVRDLGYLQKSWHLLVERLEQIDPKLRAAAEEQFKRLEDKVQRDFTDESGQLDLARASDSELLKCLREEESLVRALIRYVQPPARDGPNGEPADELSPEEQAEAERSEALMRRIAEDTARTTVQRYLKESPARVEEEVRVEESRSKRFFSLLSWLVLCPLYVFFFLLEIDPMIAAIRRYLPAVQRDRIVRIFTSIDRILSAFFRGRLIVCVVKGGITSIGLLALGVPFWFPIGMAAGFVSLIPYVGIWLAVVPALLLSWLEHESGLRLGGTGAVFALMEVVEGLVLVPTFLGKEVGLHPLTIVVTLLIFGKLFGLVGVLLSVPLAAITKILGTEFVMPLIRDFADEDPRAPPDEGTT